MKELFQELKKCLLREEGAALASIIESAGSAPRGAGSRMLVRADGSSLGTVGGKEGDIGMVCGGNVTVYIQYADPEDKELLQLVDRALAMLEVDEDSWLILDLTEENAWKMGLYSEKTGVLGVGYENTKTLEQLFGPAAVTLKTEDRFWYAEPLVQSGTVYVFGGGHVAQELVPVLKRVGFRCVVMDDRENFANPGVFPDADQIIVGNLERIGDYVAIRPQDYVCVMTRGHQYDYYVQKQALALKPCYLGVMGSKNKIRVVTERLLADGFSAEEIQSCHMPIGLAIHAETPAEIAVSVAGEMIALRAERMGKTRR